MLRPALALLLAFGSVSALTLNQPASPPPASRSQMRRATRGAWPLTWAANGCWW
ncbi:hypothetical protein [Deinococcus sp.]|uniref:hypothetical protein n=1 Tax=Deinococcus sp. TaxID=47478 RepID=UPI003CC555AA